MGEVRHIPARNDIIYLDTQMFANLVCMIPPGKVSTTEAICDMWAKRHGGGMCLLSNSGILPMSRNLFFKGKDVSRIDLITDLLSRPENTAGDFIPYYRLISPRGFLMDFGHYSSKEYSAKKLTEEGHTILNGRDGTRSFKLQDYKSALFDWNRVIINE